MVQKARAADSVNQHFGRRLLPGRAENCLGSAVRLPVGGVPPVCLPSSGRIRVLRLEAAEVVESENMLGGVLHGLHVEWEIERIDIGRGPGRTECGPPYPVFVGLGDRAVPGMEADRGVLRRQDTDRVGQDIVECTGKVCRRNRRGQREGGDLAPVTLRRADDSSPCTVQSLGCTCQPAKGEPS
jgi:hypothetical protein